MNGTPDQTRDALYAAILAHPDEDTPRLMYADYIQEHGDAQRAEFIRLQCRLATMNEWDDGYTAADVRCRRLIAEHPEWAESVRELVESDTGSCCSLHRTVNIRRPHSVFVRGFPGVMALLADRFATDHSALFRQFPIEAAGFALDYPAAREALTDCPGLARLSGLGVSMWGDEHEGLEALAQFRHVGRLKSLEVYSESVPAAPFEALLLALQFGSLESFSLQHHCYDYDPRQPRDVIRELDRASWLLSLKELALIGSEFEGLGQRLARERGWVPKLKRLSLLGYLGIYGQIAPEAVAQIGEGVRSGWFAAVEDLDLMWCDFEGLVIDALVVSGAARPVRLTLPGRNRAGYQKGLEVAPGLLRSDWCRDVLALQLDRPGEAEVSELLASALPGRLRVLGLTGGSLTGGRLRAMLDVSGGWPHLERLNLTNNPIPDGALKEFVALCDRFPRLVSVSLGNGEPAPKLLARLAESASAVRFRELQFNVPLDNAGADVLAQSPYLNEIDLISVVEGTAGSASLERLKDRFGVRLTILPNR